MVDTDMRMTMQDWGLLVFLSMIWGGAFFFAAVAVRDLPPLTVVLCRVALAATALGLYLRVRRIRPAGRDGRVPVATFLTMGLLNNVIPFSLLFWAQTEIDSGLASILNATTPIFSVLAAHFLLCDERMGAGRLAGVVLGIAGVVVLVGWDALGQASAATLGMAACLGAACSYGLATVYGRRFRDLGVPHSAVAFGQLAGSTLLMAPVALLVDRPWTLPTPSVTALAAVVALALLSTALAYVIYFRILNSAGAVNISLVTLLIPPSAIMLGAVFLDERLNAHHYAGMALIAAGLLALDGRVFRGAGFRGSRAGRGIDPPRN